MNLLIFGQNKSAVNTTLLKAYTTESCGDIWLYYQKFFAASRHYTCQITNRMSLLVDYLAV